MLGQGILETQNIFYYSNFLNSITGLYIFLDLPQEFIFFRSVCNRRICIAGDRVHHWNNSCLMTAHSNSGNMSEGRKFLKQAAMQIGAGGSAGRYKKEVHVHSYFVSTFNYKFCTQPGDISFKSVLVTCSKFCILVGLGQAIIPAWCCEVRNFYYCLSSLLFATSCWFFSVLCLVLCVCSET
jgi:hypothetical protein